MQKRIIVFGSILKEIRLKYKFKQSYVAKKLNMPLAQYKDLEKDYSYSFDYDKLEMFIELFNLTEEEKSLLLEHAFNEDEFYCDIEMFMDKTEPYIEAEWKIKIWQAEAEKERLQPASSK